MEVPSSNYCCRQKGSLTDNNIGQVFSGVTHNSTRWEHEKAKIVAFESNVQLFMCLFKCQLLSNTIKQISIICFFQSLSLHIIVLQMLSWRRNNWLFCRSPSIPVSALLSQSKTHFICPFLLSARMTGGRHIIKQPGGVPSHDSILH